MKARSTRKPLANRCYFEGASKVMAYGGNILAVPFYKVVENFLVPSRVLELRNILVPGMDEEEMADVEEDVKAECMSLGNILSTHVAGPAQLLLGDGTAAAADDGESEEDDEDVEEDDDGEDTDDDDDDDVDENIVVEGEGSGAKSTKNNVGKKSKRGNNKQVKKQKKDRTKYWGNIYMEFARPETATLAALQFSLRKYDGRAVGVKFFPLSEYQVRLVCEL